FVLALQTEGHALSEIGLGEFGRDLFLHFGALHAFGQVRGHRHHAVAADAVDIADALRGNALHEIADRHIADGRVDAQIVDLVEAPAIARKAQQDIDLLVGFGRTIFGDLHAIGDELHGAADITDAHAVFGSL